MDIKKIISEVTNSRLYKESEMLTKFNELKVSDHRLSYELKRIADALEKIADRDEW